MLKIKSGDKIPKDWRWQVESMDRFTPVAGTESQYNLYVKSVSDRLKQQARFDEACELHGEHNSDDSRALMKLESAKLEKLLRRELHFLDSWRATVRHLHDKVGVPEEDVRKIVIASLDDKLDNLDFSMNKGILGSKVAQAIRKEVSESEINAPLCANCA